jgi:hypothetical protein
VARQDAACHKQHLPRGAARAARGGQGPQGEVHRAGPGAARARATS